MSFLYIVQFYPWSEFFMGTNLSRETITTLLETKSPLDKIYLLEVHVPCFSNKIFEGSLPQTIVS